jgi:putative heme degradation protein
MDNVQTIRLVYRSYANSIFSQEDLESLLETSRKKNKTLDITGILFFVDDSFIQILEGPVQAVEELYATIKQDERHTDCKIIEKQNIELRYFQDWSMGFCVLDKENLAKLDGFNDFLYKKTDVEDFSDLGKGIHNLLDVYKDYCVDEL